MLSMVVLMIMMVMMVSHNWCLFSTSQVEQTISLCPPPAAVSQEGRGLRALHAQLATNPSQPSAEDPQSGLPSLPPSYMEAVSTPHNPLYPCAPPKYTELPEAGTTAVIR